MAQKAKPTPKAGKNAAPKLDERVRELIPKVAGKITTDPRFTYEANMMMSAHAVIIRAKKAGNSLDQIEKMSATQLRKFLDTPD